MRLSVLVTGDVVTDRDLYAGQERRPGSRMRLGTTERTVAGGAALLDLLLCEVARQRPGGGLAIARGLDYARVLPSAPMGFGVMRPFPKEAGSAARVWRMPPEPDGPLGMGTVDTDFDVSAADAAALGAAHAVVVVDDAGLAFRRWPARAAWPRFLLEPDCPLPDWLVLKLSAPLGAGDLWHTLVSGNTQDRESRTVRDPAELLTRTIGVTGINDLRVEPIHVSRDLSWERAALDLFRELAESRCAALTALRQVRFVVVALDTDGALIAEFPAGRNPRAWLVFDPADLEGDFEARVSGGVLGYQTCFTAAIVTHLAAAGGADPAAIAPTVLAEGVRAGLAAKRRLLLEGHGPVPIPPGSEPAFPAEEVAKEILRLQHEWPYGAVEIPLCSGKRGSARSSVLPRSDPWTIIAGSAAGEERPGPLWGLARRVAQHGVKQLKETPYFQCGNLFSIERTEIESLRTLYRLLRSYWKDPKATKPLSIAAFGPPGSGKSFGIKQLAAQVFRDGDPPLEFNLSQFQDPTELHGLLHQVRDRVLLGRLPVVFWDEFDSQDLKWLQFLLAPMQDGTFQEGPITHPIGKCVFVFAGGTRSRFEDFGNPPPELLRGRRAGSDPKAEREPPSRRAAEPPSNEVEAWAARFRAKKGPDFKSRLAGYINVIGPNPRDQHDITYPVRRALLLRVHLGIRPEATLTIERGLLSAFLKIGEYRHGARSLEKIAEQMGRSTRTGEFTRSDLPSRSELDLQVDADGFLALMETAL
ncbi:MAG: hypothetical protein ACT4PM_01935 [Gemmatimonadales bacterium]